METLKEIDDYEKENDFSDEQSRALFERRMQIFRRIHKWREENERLGLEPTIRIRGLRSSVKHFYKIGVTMYLMVKKVIMMK